MARNPRVSRSLRAFSGVGIQSNFLTDCELAEELIYKRKKRAELQSFTWQEFKKVVDEKSKEKDRKVVILCLNSSMLFRLTRFFLGRKYAPLTLSELQTLAFFTP